MLPPSPCRRVLAPLAVSSACWLVAAPAAAMDCFVPSAAGSTLAADPAATRSGALPVTLATGFRVNARCHYGLSPETTRMTTVPDGETDFASLAAALVAAARGGAASRPRTLYGRGDAPGAPVESVFRESCTESLAADPGVLATHVDTATGALRVARRAAGPLDCGAGHSTFRFVPVPSSGQPPGLARGAAAATLDPATSTTSLGSGQDMAVYAGRTAEGWGLLVGRVGHADPRTALRHALATATRPGAPWFTPAWSPQGDFALTPGNALNPTGDVWPEMVSAAAANALWLTEVPVQPSTAEFATAAARVLGALQVGPGGDATVLPPAVVTRVMTDRFGPAGAAMVPTLPEWDALRRRLQVCLIERYAPDREPVPTQVPDGARCARLATVAAPVALLDSVATVDTVARAPRRVCVHRTRWEMATSGVTAGVPLPPACVALPWTAAETDTGTGSTPLPLAMVGDHLVPEGPAPDLYACIDNHCQPLRADTAVWAPGLIEVRSAPTEAAAAHAEGLTLARIVALDPATAWLPGGLYTGDMVAGGTAWSSLPHDEPWVFSFVRRRQALAFSLTASPTVAAVWNARALADGQSPVLTQSLPVVGGVAGTPVAPPPSGLVVLVRRSDTCPTEPAVAVRAEVPVDPDALLVDQRFHVFLARATDDAAPYECLAHATLRVRESRALAPTSWLHVGLWGDTQAAVFLTDPAALGILQPLAYLTARLPWGFHVDATADLTAAVTLDRADVSRAGAGVALALGWGPLSVAPRLVTVGAMLHLATGAPNATPLVSPYVALDVSTLVDLAGGR